MTPAILERPPPPCDRRLPYGPESQHFGDLRIPPTSGPHPIVVALHGGYWRAPVGLDYFGHACAALTAARFATWNLEYRRIGQPGGAWPGTFLDVALGIEHLGQLASAYPLDLSRVVILGHSAGGHLGLWLAGRQRVPVGSPLEGPGWPPLRAVVSLAGGRRRRRAWALHLRQNAVAELLGGPPSELPERYAAASPPELLPLGVRQILLHGTADANVPYELSRDYQAAAAGDDATLITLPGVDHFQLVDSASSVWPEVQHAVIEASAGD